MSRRAVAVAALVVVALLAGAAFWAYQRLDVVVKVALEFFGPDVTGVSVKVGDVQISPQTGRGRLRNLELGNPPGFSAAHAARFADVIVEVEAATLRASVVHVQAIGIDKPAIVYERGDKTTNLDVIARNIEAYVKRSGDAEQAGGKGGGKRRFIIDRLLITGARVTMTAAALRGQGVTFELPAIELRDIGRRQGGVTASQASAIVANAIVAAVAQRVLSNVDLLRRGGVEGAIDALKGLLR